MRNEVRRGTAEGSVEKYRAREAAKTCRVRSGVRRYWPLVVAAIGAVALTACSSSISSVASTPTSAPTSVPGLLPRKVVVSLNAVKRYFPQITVVARSGNDETAVGDPVATASVTFTNDAGTKKVTISVDQYGDSSGASSAYREAVAKSKAVTGFKPLKVPNLGEKTFAGTVTQGSETHVGMGVLTGRLTLGATLAGFTAGAANVDNLVSLARAEVATAHANAQAPGTP
jgi:hypothetical protein